MAISSNTLFHFTKTKRNIESILTQKFKVTYCKEVFTINGIESTSYVPMISFCDLPIGQIKEHIVKYGSYAIGMTKEWGIVNKLNPVLYLEKDSIIANNILQYLSQLNNVVTKLEPVIKNSSESDLANLKKSLLESIDTHGTLFNYIKNYQGDLVREKKTYPNYRFYDEREWRFVPPHTTEGVNWKMTQEDYLRFRGTSISKKFLNEPVLNFTAKDIRYLIVKNESEIPSLIRKIKSTNNLSLSPDEADVLITKIITVDSIEKDY